MFNVFFGALMLVICSGAHAATLRYTGAQYEEIIGGLSGEECLGSCGIKLDQAHDTSMRLTVEIGFNGQLPKSTTFQFRTGNLDSEINSFHLSNISIFDGLVGFSFAMVELTTDAFRNIVSWDIYASRGSSVPDYYYVYSTPEGDSVYYHVEYGVACSERNPECVRTETIKAKSFTSGTWSLERANSNTELEPVPLPASALLLAFGLLALYRISRPPLRVA